MYVVWWFFSLSWGLEVVTHMLQFKMLQWLPFNQSFLEWLMTPGGVLCKCRLNRVCSWRRILTCPTPSTDSQILSYLNESDLLHEKKYVGSTFSSHSNLCKPREAITFHCCWSKINASDLAVEVNSVVVHKSYVPFLFSLLTFEIYCINECFRYTYALNILH